MDKFEKATGGIDKIGSDLLGMDLKSVKDSKLVELVDEEVKEETMEPPVGTGTPPSVEDVIHIPELAKVIEIVKAENAEKKLNPSVVLEGESGVNFIEGQPHLVIDNEYVPHDKAMIILQTRKVVREYLKLQNLINGIKEE